MFNLPLLVCLALVNNKVVVLLQTNKQLLVEKFEGYKTEKNEEIITFFFWNMVDKLLVGPSGSEV